jgi:hypothetical protein
MKLPFNTEQFLDVFEEYNLGVFPLQFLFYLLAVIVIWFSIQKNRISDRIIVFILFFLFIWTGIVYHILHFTAINSAAYVFGLAFVIQSLLFMYYGFVKKELSFKLKFNLYGLTGMILVFFALIVYPLIGYFKGHIYPRSPTFGVPCPTLIFTFGVILWTDQKFPKPLLIIPLLWAIVGFSAVALLGMIEDLGLLISALTCCILMFVKDPKESVTMKPKLTSQ